MFKNIILPIWVLLMLCHWANAQNAWNSQKYKGYDIVCSQTDAAHVKAYHRLIEKGKSDAEAFFKGMYKKHFTVVVHPNRHSLDSTWQKDWNMPDFSSQCWMVASGIATKLDMLSPQIWAKEACEHDYNDQTKTQQLITHELIHVYHGQVNKSPDFSEVDGIDWFVEGLATYASGQCNATRLAEIKKSVADNTYPKQLDDFWKGKNKYGLAGSMVMYIDNQYGREKLIALMPLNQKKAIMESLNTTEQELIAAWAKFISPY